MPEWVALLRGVNVGGAKRVPMADLRDMARGLGWTAVRSYIASGNLVFSAEAQAGGTTGEQAEGLAEALRGLLQGEMGIDVPTLVLGAEAFRAALAGCPYRPEKGSHVHGFFLWQEPEIDTAGLAALRAPSESFDCVGRMAWLHAPEGISRSKLALRLDRVIRGTQMTGRNLNTLRRLDEMLGDDAPGDFVPSGGSFSAKMKTGRSP